MQTKKILTAVNLFVYINATYKDTPSRIVNAYSRTDITQKRIKRLISKNAGKTKKIFLYQLC